VREGPCEAEAELPDSEEKRVSQIRNCRLEYECEKKWEDLTRIPRQSGVRHCTDCRANVFLCKTDQELDWHLANNNCIAFFAEPAFLDDPEDLNDEIPDAVLVTMGVPELPQLNSGDTERDKSPPVETLGVDDQLLEKLRRAGLDTVAYLSELKAWELNLVYDFNDTEIEVISRALASKGYSLKRT
jgi:hypothetical protein